MDSPEDGNFLQMVFQFSYSDIKCPFSLCWFVPLDDTFLFHYMVKNTIIPKKCGVGLPLVLLEDFFSVSYRISNEQ